MGIKLGQNAELFLVTDFKTIVILSISEWIISFEDQIEYTNRDGCHSKEHVQKYEY